MKRRWMSPSATPTMQSRAASRATNGDQARHQTQPSVTNTTLAAQNEGGCRQAARQPRKTEVGVAKCHACHAKWHGVTGDQRGPSASPDPAKCHKYHACHAKRRWMSPSATPATQSDRGCHQVPRLPRKVARRHGRLTGTKRDTRPSQVS